jgi:hypothetical protein
MKILRSRLLNLEHIIAMAAGIMFFFLSCVPARAQQKLLMPDRRSATVLSLSSVTKIQDLSFGVFYTGNSGGTVIVPSTGPRSATGDVILVLSGSGSPAVFQIGADNTNLITISVGNIVNLSNGAGGTLTLQINDFYPASPFSPIVGQNNVSVGGILTVGDQTSSPAGTYSGSFEITFNQE